jgi:hypothetical protein
MTLVWGACKPLKWKQSHFGPEIAAVIKQLPAEKFPTAKRMEHASGEK